jgi:hypothetical protein
MTDGECAGNFFTLQCVNQVIKMGLALAVEDLASTELLDAVEVLWLGSGETS